MKSTLYTQKFIALAITNFCILSGFGAFFMFPLFIQDHGGSRVDIGIIMGTAALASVLSKPWVSGMVDRLGRKRSYTIGTAAMSLLPLVYLLFHGLKLYAVLLLVRIAHGTAFAICMTAAFSIVADVAPGDRLNEGLGLLGVSGLIGSALGPGLGEILIRNFGFPYLFLSTAFIGLTAFLAHLPLSETYAHVPREPSDSFFHVLGRKKIATIALIAVLLGAGMAAGNVFVSPFAMRKHIGFISIYFIACSGAAAVTMLFGAKLTDRIGENRVIPYAVLLNGSGLFMLMLLGGPLILFVSGILCGCGQGFLLPGLNALMLRDEPAHARGNITGIYTGSIDAGNFIGAVALGYVGDLMGFPSLFFTAGCALLAGLALYAGLRPNALNASCRIS